MRLSSYRNQKGFSGVGEQAGQFVAMAYVCNTLVQEAYLPLSQFNLQTRSILWLLTVFTCNAMYSSVLFQQDI